ncbi:MAG: hypothetical protein R2745_01620 [Vicinamibacterales bacterium]
MSRSFLPAAIVSIGVSLSVLVGGAQDALTVSSDAYRLEFENAWVKVTRVIYGAHAVLAPHHHTERASAYVYLNDGPPVLFKHEGLPYAGVTRPATAAGSFRVYKGIKEVHSVENATATPSDFLRVEFKTEPLEEALLKGKFFREAPIPGTTVERTQFENAQVRITRVRVVDGKVVTVVTGDHPALLVALAPTSITQDRSPGRLIDAGKTAWLGPGHTASVTPVGSAGEVLRFDFKTAPMSKAPNQP